MVQQPSFSEWQQVLDLVKQAVQQEQHEMLLTMLMTPDEREALVARVNIVHELLQGELSQRQISQMLGSGLQPSRVVRMSSSHGVKMRKRH